MHLQVKMNKTQAESMARFLENQLKSGMSKQEIPNNLQKAVSGLNENKSFICLFDKYDAELICHPDNNKTGTKLSASSSFKNILTGEKEKSRNIILEGVPTGGFFYTPQRTDIVYMVPVKGTQWMLSIHKNSESIVKEIANRKKIFLIGFAILAFISAIFASFFVYLAGKQKHENPETEQPDIKQISNDLDNANAQIKEKDEALSLQNKTIDDLKTVLNETNALIDKHNKQLQSDSANMEHIKKIMAPKNKFDANLFKDSFIFHTQANKEQNAFFRTEKINNHIVCILGNFTADNDLQRISGMFKTAFLNEIIKGLAHEQPLKAADIPEKLRNKILSLQNNTENPTENIINLSIIILHTDNLVLQFSGTGMPLYIIRRNKLTEVPTEDLPIGLQSNTEQKFINKRAQLQAGDTLYLFAEMQAEKNAKQTFVEDYCKELIEKIPDKTLSEQKEAITKAFESSEDTAIQQNEIVIAGIRI